MRTLEQALLVVCGLAFPFEHVSCQRENVEIYSTDISDFLGSTIDFSEFDALTFLCVLLSVPIYL